ncbi:hypothetical protein SRABI112_05096 [Pseudomonas mediterranea]|nr:hypothetical protein SRABI112_05096 [Pseudomonas mediterranea]
MLGQFAQGGLGEQGAQVDLGTEILVQAGLQLHGQQGMATQFEEPVVPADLIQVQQVLPDLGDGDFGVTLGCFVGLAGEGFQARLGQGAAVELAVGGQGQGVQVHEGAGHHVFGQVLEQGAAQLFGRHRFTADIGHQALALGLAGDVFPGDDHHFANAGAQGKGRFDFADLDAQTADLHLEVIPAQVFQRAVGEPAAEVAGLVQTGVRLAAERVGDKAFGAELRQVEVPARHADAADMDFPGDTQWLWSATGVEHVHLDVGDRLADGHAFAGIAGAAVPGGHVDGRFGRTVQVMQFNAGQLPFETPLQGTGQGFATAQHPTQFGEVAVVGVLQEQVEHRRHEVQHGDARLAHYLGQVSRFLMTAGTGHDQLGASQQGQEELPDRHVETERGLLQDPVAGVDAVLVPGPQQAIDHAQVFVHHPFRGTGGARGIEHVGQVLRRQAKRLRIRIVCGKRAQDVLVIERQRRDIQWRQLVQQGVAAQYSAGGTVFEHIDLARTRQVRVDGHIGAAGLEHAQQGDDHFRAALEAHGHPGVRLHAEFDQAMGELVGLAVELFVAEQRPTVAAHGAVMRTLLDLLFEQGVDQHIPRIFAGGGIELDLQALPLGRAHQRVVAHWRVMLLKYRFEHRDDALLQQAGFFHAVVGGVEVEVQMHVFERMVVAHEDRHGRLFVTVVHGDDGGGGTAELVVTVQAFE